jgi:hypothetical protein
VTENTRGENILDLILTTDKYLIDNVRVGEPFGTSDHNVVRFSINISKEKIYNNNAMPNYFKANYDEIRNFINETYIEENSNETENENSNECDIEEYWKKFSVTLEIAKKNFIPVKSIGIKKSLWVTKKVVKLRRAKNKAWKKYKVNPTKELYEKYKKKLKLSNSRNKSAKIEFESKLAENSKFNSKSFFAYVKSKQRTRDRVGPLKKDGLIVTDNKEAANILNEHFTSVFTQEDVSCMPKPEIVFNGLEEEELSDIEITADMVGKKLDKLKTDKSPGPDGIHSKLLYEIRDIIKKPLALLFQQSLFEGKLPEDWKSAIITPLFKKGSKADPQNYRPVSLTSIVCKIFESVLKDKILEHLEKHSLIRDSQHGFTRGRSCLTNLLDFLEEVTKELDKGNAVDIIYLDFAKAFDKVPHRRLVEKIRSHGISGKIASWIGEWLKDRKQKVNVGQCFSDF